MKESIHYLLMADHFLVQKSLLASIRESGLTPGQPKILDYLKNHDGCVQKEIARGCHIEPASITVILKGMESKGYIERKMLGGDRRSLYVFLTDKGKQYVEYLNEKFDKVESMALKNFSDDEKEQFNDLLMRVYENMIDNDKEDKA
ncbi:MarR family winged helix-turn-helix transcriptional regulator [Ruminococcus sp.]|uniref:MarR family winged helix-turn-helix transcriptional regulator n=1 Tax=Ruminococcus sp. TaxID=41978 RepID=UPI0038687A49